MPSPREPWSRSQLFKCLAVKTAVAIAVAVFNDGAKSYVAIMEMGLKSTRYLRTFHQSRDKACIRRARRNASEASLESRRAKRRLRLACGEQQEEAEGFPYLSGAHE
ncbi:hypothetical protein PoB_005100700 [Plakobranchus ocellatus]|uniref:Uncharacterized protein n=1 Tax=Plakobranchus ocellatus TaxID=259542 RepID=A0AAV4BZH3_9GAST|nr:hypothetical protein PoB_005100700 [Plakobranchus ocellatus]